MYHQVLLIVLVVMLLCSTLDENTTTFEHTIHLGLEMIRAPCAITMTCISIDQTRTQHNLYVNTKVGLQILL